MKQRRFHFLSLYAGLFVVFLYGPTLLLPLFSFNDGIFAIFPLNGFTTKHYMTMASNTAMIQALYNSLAVATFAAIVTTALSLPLSIVLTRRLLPASDLLLSTVMLPLVVPTTVAAPPPVDRSTSYPVTPTLSVDAAHVRLTLDEVTLLAVGWPGTLGACVSLLPPPPLTVAENEFTASPAPPIHGSNPAWMLVRYQELVTAPRERTSPMRAPIPRGGNPSSTGMPGRPAARCPMSARARPTTTACATSTASCGNGYSTWAR